MDKSVRTYFGQAREDISTDKTSLKADREVEGGGGWGFTWSLLDSLETVSFAWVLRTSGTKGDGGAAPPKKKDMWQKI